MKVQKFILLVLVIMFIVKTNTQAQIITSHQSQGKNVRQYLPKPLYPDLFKTVPLISDVSPEWVKLMYSNAPNIFAIEDAYEAYYRTHDYIKNTHTQNYKYFSRIVSNERFYDDLGVISKPTLEQIKEREIAEKKKYALAQSSNSENRSANWTCLGPFETFDTDGFTYKSAQVNVYTISQSKSNPNVLFAGSEGGNIFKTTDKGLNWNLISKEMNLGGPGAIEIDPLDENTVYLGQGNRLYKTIDGGVVWSIMDDVSDLKITDISVNPSNTNIVYTAGNKGLKRSTDGGITWTTIISDRCWDIELKTDSPSTIFVAKSNLVNQTTEIWKSIDNGLSFSPKISGWFSPVGGVAANTGGARIGVTDADPNRIYVILIGNENDAVDDNNYIGIYKSTDAGETWTTPYDGNGDGLPDNEPGGPYSNDHWCFTHFGLTTTGYNQGFYDLAIDVSDIDADKFLVGSLNLFKSEDGGVTYTAWGGYQCQSCGSGYRHPDIQEIESNGSDVWVTTDGGVDYYNSNLDYQESRTKGITGSAYWGLGQGWNEDVVTGGRYHNGNGAHYEGYGFGKFLALGGGESPTGYVNQGDNKKVYHSDISGKLLPSTLTGGVTNISNYSLFPNQAYVSNQKSEIVTDPRSWNTLYLGQENKVWKSTDGGNSFNVIGLFGLITDDKVLGIEISRNNPEVIYAVQRIAGGGKVYKTIDGGANWSQLSLPASTKEMYISVSGSDENVIYLALDNGYSSTNKIFKSIDGGGSWTNISDPIMNDEWPKGIQVQDGTDGGVYVVTTKHVYYKNNSIGWTLFSQGLPAKINYEGFLPFYRDEKVRLATENVAIWESPFYESSAPIAQPMASTNNSFCTRDTIYFEDYSIRKDGASWSWSFAPAPQWVSSISARNPKVVFGTAGTYSATLTVTDAGGTSTKIVNNIVTITNECDPDIVPGNALVCSNTGDYGVLPDLNISTNEITFTAWIKPNGNQPDYSGIIFNDGTSAGLNFRSGKLAYHWPGGAYWWDSGLTVPLDEWSHVVLVCKPTGITVYLNGQPSTHSFTAGVVDFGTMKIGSYKGWSSRNYKGEIDEVAIYNRSLSTDEIRALRHLTKVPTDDPSLIHYYQFNRTNGIATDRVSNLHCSLAGGASRSTSTAPVGSGVNQKLTVNSSGIYDFIGTDVSMTFPTTGTYPNGELYVTKLNLEPDQNPGSDPVSQNRYWIVNNYGTNATFTQLESINFSGLSNVNTSNNGRNNELHKRSSNADGNTWGASIDVGDMATNTSVTFSTDNSITSFSQFSINSSVVLPLTWLDFNVSTNSNKYGVLKWTTSHEVNVKYFEVERSEDGLEFEQIDIQNAKGEANTVNSYVFIDENPLRGYNYYRIKQVDFDGNFTYSPIKSIFLNGLSDKIIVYPNPSINNNVITVKSVFKERLKIELYSIKGKFIKSSYIENGQDTFDVSTIDKGTYMYKIIGRTYMKNGIIVLQ